MADKNTIRPKSRKAVSIDKKAILEAILAVKEEKYDF